LPTLISSAKQGGYKRSGNPFVRRARLEDLPRIMEIYNEAVKSSTATFDVHEQTIAQRKRWFLEHDQKHPLIVAELDGEVVGYCSLSKFREKPAYDLTVESSVYVHEANRGRGIGKMLMTEIIQMATDAKYHTIIAGIAGKNEESAKLHESLGFVCVGSLKEVGFKFGKWHDVRYYQLLLS
jgi:L-amino acid N-acyltransferase